MATKIGNTGLIFNSETGTPTTLASPPGGTKSLASNGYYKFANGIIMQWGTSPTVNRAVSTPTLSSPATAPFSIAFPTGCIKAFVTHGDGKGTCICRWDNSNIYWSVNGSGGPNFAQGTDTATFVKWFAFGY